MRKCALRALLPYWSESYHRRRNRPGDSRRMHRMRGMHRKWFDLSDESFAAIHYRVLAYFKLLWIVFNLTPYLALRLFV